MELKETTAKLRDMAENGVCDPVDRQAFSAAAEAIALVAWAEEVGARVSQQWRRGDTYVWGCNVTNPTHFKRMFSDGEAPTLLGCIRAAKEAYENEK